MRMRVVRSRVAVAAAAPAPSSSSDDSRNNSGGDSDGDASETAEVAEATRAAAVAELLSGLNLDNGKARKFERAAEALWSETPLCQSSAGRVPLPPPDMDAVCRGMRAPPTATTAEPQLDRQQDGSSKTRRPR